MLEPNKIRMNFKKNKLMKTLKLKLIKLFKNIFIMRKNKKMNNHNMENPNCQKLLRNLMKMHHDWINENLLREYIICKLIT